MRSDPQFRSQVSQIPTQFGVSTLSQISLGQEAKKNFVLLYYLRDGVT